MTTAIATAPPADPRPPAMPAWKLTNTNLEPVSGTTEALALTFTRPLNPPRPSARAALQSAASRERELWRQGSAAWKEYDRLRAQLAATRRELADANEAATKAEADLKAALASGSSTAGPEKELARLRGQPDVLDIRLKHLSELQAAARDRAAGEWKAALAALRTRFREQADQEFATATAAVAAAVREELFALCQVHDRRMALHLDPGMFSGLEEP
jgi:hypothetical protein